MSKIVGYIIVNPNTDELTWDGQLHATKQDAIKSLTGLYGGYSNRESDDPDDRRPWWDDYAIHPVQTAINGPQGAGQ